MNILLHSILLVPLLGFILSLLIKEKNENIISNTAFFTLGLNLIISASFIIWWLFEGGHSINFKDVSIYKEKDFDFLIDFFFDHITAVFLLVGNIIVFLVIGFSRFYMHREEGYKRFFNTILFFWLGYVITILSGNFGTLFIGWEILGISSFLLIAFYRHRYLPVKNALKIFSIYRIGDVGILLAMWGSHHLWHKNILFAEMNNLDYSLNPLMTIFISLMILIAALAKSAQLPFTAWLPRAMEGPTPSSAIFYGSLSVHIGAFLLLRTFNLWENYISVRWLIGILGISTAIIASLIGRVQSTIKGQIAYSSAAQIGIIFLEIALGLEILALVHFVGNAFLRSYQLLVSPSVVAYMIRYQMFNPDAEKLQKLSPFFQKIRTSLYFLSIREWYLDRVIFKIIFEPLKSIRFILKFLTLKNVFFFLVPLYLGGMFLIVFHYNTISPFKDYFAIPSALLAFLIVAKAYAERGSARLTWILLVLSHFFIDLAISMNDGFNLMESAIYLSGIILSGTIGYLCLLRIKVKDLNNYQGFVENYRVIGFVFLMACLGIAGFPITTTFLGEDLKLAHIHSNQVLLAFLVSITFIVNGIAVIRIFARVFLGNFHKNFQTTSGLTI